MAYTNLKSELFSPVLLEKLYETSVMANLINMSWGAVGASTVHIRQVGSATIGDYVAGTPITYETPAGLDNELVLSIQKYASVQVDDVDEIETNADIMSGLANDIMMQLALTFDRDIMDTAVLGVDSANVNTAVLTSSTAYEAINALTELALINLWTPEYIVVHPTILTFLKSDVRFASNRGDMANSGFEMTKGFVGSIDGVGVYTSTFAVDRVRAGQAGEPVVLVGMRNSIAGGMAIKTMESLRLETQFADAVRGLYKYGVVVLKDEAGTTTKRLALHIQK